jgi:hypothetical protein
MKETSYDIRKAYISLLDGSLNYKGISVKVYNQWVSVGETPQYYVLVSNQQVTGTNTKQSFNTDSSIQLSIISKELGDNSGQANDMIASQILAKIYPSTVGSEIESQNFQVVSTELINDITLESFDDGMMRVIQRIITFQHKTTQIV